MIFKSEDQCFKEMKKNLPYYMVRAIAQEQCAMRSYLKLVLEAA